MTADACDDVNGASLIVAFDDGVATNNRDIVFFEGNDSNETDGWHAALPGITFTAGRCRRSTSAVCSVLRAPIP